MQLSIFKHKWKLLLLLLLFNLKKHYKYILFYIYSKTKAGHAMIEDKKEKAKQIIKKDLFRTNFAHNYDRIAWYGFEYEEMDKILTDRKNNVNSRISGCIYTCDFDL